MYSGTKSKASMVLKLLVYNKVKDQENKRQKTNATKKLKK